MLTNAMFQARELAMTRMEEEADLLGADGVVGVRLLFKQYAMDEGVLEFQAMAPRSVTSNGSAASARRTTGPSLPT